LEYRKANLEDVEQVSRLWQKMMKELDTPFSEYDEAARMMYLNSVMNGLFSQNSLLLVAVEGGIIYGFAQLDVVVKPYGVKPSILYTHRYVEMSHRNTEVASKLQEEATQHFEYADVPLVEVFVPVGNIKLYERLGFKAAFVQMYKPFQEE